jgi:hypothetical protein
MPALLRVLGKSPKGGNWFHPFDLSHWVRKSSSSMDDFVRSCSRPSRFSIQYPARVRWMEMSGITIHPHCYWTQFLFKASRRSIRSAPGGPPTRPFTTGGFPPHSKVRSPGVTSCYGCPFLPRGRHSRWLRGHASVNPDQHLIQKQPPLARGPICNARLRRSLATLR